MKLIKQNWFTLPIAGLMLFVTVGFIFTPHLPFSNNPLVEKFCEYAVHGMFLLLMLSLLFFATAKYKLMFVGMSCVGALCIFLKSASNDHLILPENTMAPKMSIAHFNLSYIGENYEEFIQRIKDVDADIVSLQELTPDWDLYLKTHLADKYPHVLKNVRIDPFGKALFAKNELVSRDTIDAKGNPILKSMLKLGDRTVNLMSAYILPPLNESSRNNAIDQLDILSVKVKGSRKPTIIIGDLNMVYWSNEIRAFRKDAGLENSRRGFTPLGFKIPYDHMFYSEQLECSRFEELQDSLSNHLGILGTFQLKSDSNDDEIRASVENLGSK